MSKSIVHIGKEANKLDAQLTAGVDPEAQMEFGGVNGVGTNRMKAVAAAIRLGHCGWTERGLSRKHVSVVASGDSSVTEATLSNIERAISGLEIAETQRTELVRKALSCLGSECNRSGLRPVAAELSIDTGYLSRLLSGSRNLPPKPPRPYRIKAVMIAARPNKVAAMLNFTVMVMRISRLSFASSISQSCCLAIAKSNSFTASLHKPGAGDADRHLAWPRGLV